MSTTTDLIGRDEARAATRTNMFVVATIEARGASGPVRVRNLSPAGAMIEGASLPPSGDRIELRRGASAISGTVIWCHLGKAGIRFDGRVDVAEWMPGGNAGQQRIDQVLHQTRSASPAHAGPIIGTHDDLLAPTQLRRLARAIDALADDLADDAVAVAKFATKLQALDIASQVLRKLADQQA